MNGTSKGTKELVLYFCKQNLHV